MIGLKAFRNRVMAVPGVTPATQAMTSRGLLPGRIWRRLQPLGVSTVRPVSGGQFRYLATAGDAMARAVVWTHMRQWEETTQPVLADLAREARVFVDGGAYTGVYTLLATAVNPRLHVVAFEANPATAGLLRANVAINGLTDRVQVVEQALSDRLGTTDFFIGADPTAAGLYGDGARITVARTPADAHLARLEVDLVKMDVEGHEPTALRGMTETLRRCQPALVIECLSARALAEVRAVTDPLGYTRCEYLGPDGPVPVTTVREPEPRYANFLLRVSR